MHPNTKLKISRKNPDKNETFQYPPLRTNKGRNKKRDRDREKKSKRHLYIKRKKERERERNRKTTVKHTNS